MYVFLPYVVYFVELNGEILEALNKASIIITDKIFLEGKELPGLKAFEQGRP